MFDEDDLLPLSALQHFIFCPRQCALIHVEGLWAENRLTVEGRHLHERADGAKVGPCGGGRAESRTRSLADVPALGDRSSDCPTPVRVTTVRSLPIRSMRLGLSGRADVVEFHRPVGSAGRGPGTPFPVEYKRGKPKSHRADEVQLCAQALCLEEMLSLPAGRVAVGSLYYGRTRRRTDVTFDAGLRGLTETTAALIHDMVRNGRTPRAVRERKCDRCSLLDLCLPDGTSPGRSAHRYLSSLLHSESTEAAP
ncbi:MAG: CRISPR-associated protein Cas4 [Phycisphaeraceae bacterium]|nr:CRISPR-associated protein Cas4 [Phycisphaeraceae bacterium]